MRVKNGTVPVVYPDYVAYQKLIASFVKYLLVNEQNGAQSDLRYSQ